jgi:hypothetical protein
MNSSNSQIVVYADDSYVVCWSRTREDLKNILEMSLTKHVNWLRDQGLLVNASKTELLLFGDGQLDVSLEGSLLVSSNSMNVLGVEFDAKLSWKNHLEKAIKVCQRIKPALWCLKRKLKRKELLKVITSHYYSKLYYGSEIWYHCLSTSLRESISPVHYFPLRLALHKFERTFSRKNINIAAKRAPQTSLIISN